MVHNSKAKKKNAKRAENYIHTTLRNKPLCSSCRNEQKKRKGNEMMEKKSSKKRKKIKLVKIRRDEKKVL